MANSSSDTYSTDNVAAASGQHLDIAIVGAGMVGACFAARVASSPWGQSLRIGLIEAAPFVMPDLFRGFDPRVVALTETSRQLLEDTGVWWPIASTRCCPYQKMSIWEGDGTGQVDFDSHAVRQPNLGHIVENSRVVEALHHRIAALPNIQLLCPAKVKNVWRNEKGDMTVQLQDAQCGGGEYTTLTADLLVAADGARSNVRDLCQFKVREWDYHHSAIVTTITTENSHQYTAWQRFLPTGPLALLPLQDDMGDTHHCSIVWSQQRSEADSLMSLNDDDFCQRLTQASSQCLGNITAVDKRFCIPLWQRHAVDYIQPNTVLLGDAAHSIHPLAGQGVNLGLADVQVLFEELERATSRGLPLSELQTLKRYQRRRKPDNLATMAAMEAFKRIYEADALPIKLLRNDGMKLVNRLQPLKKLLVKQAMGLS